MDKTRRSFLHDFLFSVSMLAVAGRPTLGFADTVAETSAIKFEEVIGQAEALSRDAFDAGAAKSRADLAELTYDQYRDIRFRRDRAVWRDAKLNFEIDLFHPGFRFTRPVEVDLVEDGATKSVPFSTDLFDYGPRVEPPSDPSGLSFSGFRARYPINAPDRLDEFVVFQGASYFRAVGAGQRYGLSARGLVINRPDGNGEEFPDFRKFWLIRPNPGDNSLIVLALLDSPSTTGAYRFTLRPGENTTIDVELSLFPRVEVQNIGLAPLTSMFLFDAAQRFQYDDFRNAVHDSSGLQMLTGKGERLIRPLANPALLQISAFIDNNPRGFGLVQRAREFADYQDMDTRFDLRPSAWIEPVGEWGSGAVVLTEIPTDTQTNDNVVAYWRPDRDLKPNERFDLAYRLYFCDTPPDDVPLARVVATRSGLSVDRQRRLFVIDFVDLPAEALEPVAEVSASTGVIMNVTARPSPEEDLYRVSFEMDPGDETLVEMRLVLVGPTGPSSETWLYRWTSA